jgi:hypothetical protein
MTLNRGHHNQRPPNQQYHRMKRLKKMTLRMILVRAANSLRHPLRINKTVFQCTLLLIIGHALTYMSVIVLKIWPDWTKEMVDKFWSPYFKFKMERYWYFKNATDLFLLAIVFYVLAKVANKFSTSLFLVAVIFFGYHVIDFFMFWWDFNGSFYLYVYLLWTCLVLIQTALFPFKEETLGKIRSLF